MNIKFSTVVAVHVLYKCFESKVSYPFLGCEIARPCMHVSLHVYWKASFPFLLWKVVSVMNRMQSGFSVSCNCLKV